MDNKLFYLLNISGSRVSIKNPSIVLNKNQCSYFAVDENAIRCSSEINIFLSKGYIKLLDIQEHDKLFPQDRMHENQNKVIDISPYINKKSIIKEVKPQNNNIVKEKNRDIVDVAGDVSEEEIQNEYDKQVENLSSNITKVVEKFEKTITNKNSEDDEVIPNSDILKLIKKSSLCESLLKKSFIEKKQFIDKTTDVCILKELSIHDSDINIKNLCNAKYKKIFNEQSSVKDVAKDIPKVSNK